MLESENEMRQSSVKTILIITYIDDCNVEKLWLAKVHLQIPKT